MPAAKNQSLFEEPPHTLVKALKYALDNPALTQADLRFAFRTSPELILSAHRPLICARTTKAFRARYMPALENIDQEHDYENPLIITLDPDHVQPDLFGDILHYWYTGVFERATNVLTTTFGVEATGRDGIGVKDGPQHANIIDPSSADASARLAEDMFNLWKEGTYSDVELTLPPLSRPSSQVEQPLLPPGPYHAHRFLLSSHSSYFSAMLSVSLAESTTLALHSDIFPPVTLTSFLHFAYTGHLPPIPETSTLKQRLNHFELLHLAGDFLGMGDSLCVHTAYHLAALAHNLTTCRCDQCQQVLPPLLIIAHRHLRTGTSSLLDACGRVLSDPVGMHLTWPHRPIAELSPPALRDTIASCTITRIVPANAIDSLQSTHALSMALEAHAAESWSHTITTTMLKPILAHTTGLIVAGFPTITSSSPTFLACVDGMGLSLDFLDFLLVHVVKQLGDATVGKVYQAVVRDLLGRGSVVDNFAVREVLEKAREGCVAYVRRRWAAMKAVKGLEGIDEGIVRMLADDTAVPIEILATSTAVSSLFLLNGFAYSPARKDNQPITPPQRPSRGNPGPSTTGAPISVSKSTTRSTPRLKTAMAPSTSTLRSALRSSASSIAPLLSIRPSSTSSGPAASTSTPLSTSPSSNSRQSRPTTTHPPPLPHVPPRNTSKTTRRAAPPARTTSLPVRSQPTPVDRALAVGERVSLPRRGSHGTGTVRFVGRVAFAEGTWVGVEVDSGEGNNDGAVKGVRYFQVLGQRGVFLRAADVVRVDDDEARWGKR